MTDESKELKIHIAPEVLEQMAEDDEISKAMKDMIAIFHQANHAVQSGQYKTFDDAMEAITGERPEAISFECDDEEE